MCLDRRLGRFAVWLGNKAEGPRFLNALTRINRPWGIGRPSVDAWFADLTLRPQICEGTPKGDSALTK